MSKKKILLIAVALVIVAVGIIAAPIAILLFANVATDMPLDTYVKFWWLGAVILWIGIPGIISGVFYYKKWNGKL